jgi:sensor histidine kinase regulating citrate/malate metabolism
MQILLYAKLKSCPVHSFVSAIMLRAFEHEFLKKLTIFRGFLNLQWCTQLTILLTDYFVVDMHADSDQWLNIMIAAVALAIIILITLKCLRLSKLCEFF